MAASAQGQQQQRRGGGRAAGQRRQRSGSRAVLAAEQWQQSSGRVTEQWCQHDRGKVTAAQQWRCKVAEAAERQRQREGNGVRYVALLLQHTSQF
jgi:hypothetical protein